MDATLTQILAELYAAHRTIDALNYELAQARERLGQVETPHPETTGERNGAVTAVPL